MWVVGKIYHPKFGKFLHLENIKNKIFQAVKRKEEQFPDLVISYISTAFLIHPAIIDRLPWEITFSLFMLGVSKSIPTKELPILKAHKQKDEKNQWDYDERTRFMYLHILSKTYGWTIEYIDKLEIDTAIALIQEAITDEQLDKEFFWSMSDKSYIYNYQTKSGKPNPLERPYFMREPIAEPAKIQMPANVLPAGVDYSSVPEEFRPH